MNRTLQQLSIDKLLGGGEGEVGMGSSLGLSLANAFLAHYEQIWFNNSLDKFKPVHYKRNVFDIFLVVFFSSTEKS